MAVPIHASIDSARAALAAEAHAAGFAEPIERRWAPGLTVETHGHPFAARAVLTEGEMWLTQGEVTRHLQAGDRFELAPDELHAERYGDAGAVYWVARRHR